MYEATCVKPIWTNRECWHHCSQLCYLCAGELLSFHYEEVWCNSWISSSLLVHIGHAVQRSSLHSNLQPNVTEKARAMAQNGSQIWNVGSKVSAVHTHVSTAIYRLFILCGPSARLNKNHLGRGGTLLAKINVKDLRTAVLWDVMLCSMADHYPTLNMGTYLLSACVYSINTALSTPVLNSNCSLLKNFMCITILLFHKWRWKSQFSVNILIYFVFQVLMPRGYWNPII